MPAWGWNSDNTTIILYQMLFFLNTDLGTAIRGISTLAKVKQVEIRLNDAQRSYA